MIMATMPARKKTIMVLLVMLNQWILSSGLPLCGGVGERGGGDM
jgi:hypothetical protein